MLNILKFAALSPPPPKKNKMPVILQQETPHTVRHHYTNLDAEMAMDIDDQAHVNLADYPVPNTPPGQGRGGPTTTSTPRTRLYECQRNCPTG